MAKNKSKQSNWLIVGVVLALVVMAGAVFKMADSPETPTGDVTGGEENPSVQCSKDYEKTISFVDRDSYEKAQDAGNVTYKVWKVMVAEDGTEVKIPQEDTTSDLTIGYGETFEVVGMLTTDNATHVYEQFQVDGNCVGPNDKVFYFTDVPDSISSIFENSKVTGPIASDNRLSIPQDTLRTVKATFTGDTKTEADAIIVWDVNDTSISEVDSNMADASTPEDHTTQTGEKSYTFELDKFESSNDVLANFDFAIDEDAGLGNVTATYTIYQYQTGYVDSDTGEWVNTPAIEDNDEEVLLPTYTGSLYLTVTS